MKKRMEFGANLGH